MTDAARECLNWGMTRRRLRYTIQIIPEEDGRGYYVTVPALPGCFSQGRTIEAATRNAREAITLHVRSLRADGVEIPVEAEGAFRVAIEVAA